MSYHHTTSDNSTINGVRYNLRHIETLGGDTFLLRRMDRTVLGTLEVDHLDRTADVERSDGTRVSVDYPTAEKVDIYQAARIILEHI